MRAIPDNNLSYPVLIERTNGSGSGFFLNFPNTICLVTAKHVLFDAQGRLKSQEARLTSYRNNVRSILHANLEQLNQDGNIRSHAVSDVAVVRIATKEPEGGQAQLANGCVNVEAGDGILGAPVGFVSRFADVLISNDVYVFGYPNSISTPQLDQIDKSRPLLRKGIVAGTNTINSTIIIDCPVYQGNSGGLVLQVHRQGLGNALRVIGVVASMIPFVEKMLSVEYQFVNTNIENSGYAVVTPMDPVLELAEHWEPQNNPAAQENA